MSSAYANPNTGLLEDGQYPGSSGYWSTDPTYGPHGQQRQGLYPGDLGRLAAGLPTSEAAKRAGGMVSEPIWDNVNGIYINPITRQPFTGKAKNGMYIQNGISKGYQDPASFNTAAIDPNNPNQRYQAVEIPKAPDISSATKDLVQQFKDTAEQSLKGFDDHLKEFTSGVSGAGKAGQAAIAAAGPTANALSRQQADYAKALTSSANDYRNLNADTAAKEKGVVQEAKDLLPSYDQAGNDIANRQMQEVVKNLSRYKLSTGTPTSAGSDESRILASAAADVMLPLKQAQINRRYDILSGLELPTTQDVANRRTAEISQFDPSVAGQIYSSGTATTQQVQALKEHVAGMSYDNAERTLRDMGVPSTMINTILGGNISSLSGLAGLEDQSNYRGLQDRLGVNVSQPVYYDQGNPAYPTPSRYSTGGTGNTATQPPLASNAPIQVGPGNAQQPRQPNPVDIAYKQQTGYFPWEDPQFTNEVYQNIASRMPAANVASVGPSIYPVNTSGAGDYNQPSGVYA